MNPLFTALNPFYMAPADGEGGDIGGAPPVDRGDEVDAPAPEPKVEHDDQIDDFITPAEGAESDAEVESDDTGDEQPRGKDGKFARKEHVPKQRFDEAVGKERAAREAAERRAQELEAKLQQETKNVDVQKLEAEVEELEKKYNDYLMDGEKDKAAAVMKAIRLSERQIAHMESDEKSSRATAAAVEQVRMESTIASLEAAYPSFNPDSDAFDQDLIDIVIAEQARLMQQDRMPPSKALQAAASKIMKKFGPVEGKGEAKGLSAAKGSDRKQEQVAKNLDTSRRQPGSMKESGKDSDKAGESKIDVAALTAAEFAALPESTKQRLRGDTL